MCDDCHEPHGWVNGEPAPEFAGANAWLSPVGVYYPCVYEGHYDLAVLLLRRGVEEYSVNLNVTDPEHTLELAGWVKISAENVVTYNEALVTGRQMDALWDWCVRNNTTKVSWQYTEYDFPEFLRLVQRMGSAA